MWPRLIPVLKQPLKRVSCWKRNMSGYDEKQDFKENVTITILGPIVPYSRMLGLLLKQCEGVKEIRLYDVRDSVCSAAIDLSHIDTDTLVRAYQGDARLLQGAITDADIVVITGTKDLKSGDPTGSFYANADDVRHYAVQLAEFNPKGIILVATPPTEYMVPLISEELKKAEVYNPKKVIGLMNGASIRANSILAAHYKKNPTHFLVPVIGGNTNQTLVTVFSQALPKSELNNKDADKLGDAIRKADMEASKRKVAECGSGCFLSDAFAHARFITSLVNAMRGNKGIFECAFVRQTGHVSDFLEYMGTVVELGHEGIREAFMPKINERECKALMAAYPYIKKAIDIGAGYVNGYVYRANRIGALDTSECQTLIKTPVEVVGDVVIDLKKKYRNFEIIQ